MSTLPLVLRLAEDLGNLSTGYDDWLGFYPHRRFYRPALQTFPAEGLFERQLLTRPSNDALMNVGKDGFQVCIDVQQFKPSEITVKTVDNVVVIEGKHEEREDDHGFISRHFVRKYTLPKDYDSNSVISTLSSDGVLTVKAPPPPKSGDSNERFIQIQHTGPAHLSVKENPKDEKIQK